MRAHFQAFLAVVLLAPGLAIGQTIPGDVTFEIPINLTRLDPAITKVLVHCVIYPAGTSAIERDAHGRPRRPALTAQMEIPVSSGRVVTTANVVVRVPPDAVEKSASKPAYYECYIMGGRNSGTGMPFADDRGTRTEFRLTPAPQNLTGSFAW